MIKKITGPLRDGIPYSAAIAMIAALVVSASAADSAGPRLSEYLAAAIASAKYPPATVGFALGEVETDSLAVSLGADSPMVPASVEKLVTAAVALEKLGPGYHFTTTVLCDSGFNADSGRVKGDLYVRGGGDPGILTEKLWLLARQLRHRGVRTVEGDLVLDDRFFDTVAVGPGYKDDSTGRAYEAPVGALAATFNCVCVHVRPAARVGDSVRAELFPPLQGVRVSNAAKTGPAGKQGTLEVRTDLNKGVLRVSLSGTMAVDDPPRYIYRKALQPTRNFGDGLRAFMGECGIRVAGKTRIDRVPDSAAVLDTILVYESPPLSEFVGHMFKYSSNFAAEMVFKALAARQGVPGSWEGGAHEVAQWWKSRGLPGTPVIKNGSGMGKVNRISAAQIVALLRYVWKQKSYLPEYLSALSTSNADGTLKSRFKDSPLKGIVRAKTGTLNDYGVSTLAGYVLLGDRTYAFAILINNPRAQQFASWTLQEKLLESAVARLRAGK